MNLVMVREGRACPAAGDDGLAGAPRVLNRTWSRQRRASIVQIYLLVTGAGGGGSGLVALAWAKHAWPICAGFAVIKPSALISSGVGRWNTLAGALFARR